MVLGLRSKNRKRHFSAQVDYLIHVLEIKPWPPSQSLKSIESVFLLWENGDHSSGSFTSNVGDGKIEISESFRLPVTLYSEAPRRGTVRASSQKNYLEFSLYETRKDKAMKGQLLGSAVINLADYGIIKDAVTISTLINFKKNSKSTVQPVLSVNIQPFERDSTSLSKEASLDKDGSESVSEVTNENDEESEIASFTDDDVDDNFSSHSSRTASSLAMESSRGSPGQDEKNFPGSGNSDLRRVNGELTLLSGVPSSNPEVKSTNEAFKQLNEASRPPSSTGLSSNLRSSVNDFLGKVVSSDGCIQMAKNSNHAENEASQSNQEAGKKDKKYEKSGLEVIATSNLHVAIMEDKLKKQQHGDGRNVEFLAEKKHTLEEEELVGKLAQEATGRPAKLRSNTLAFNRAANGVQGNTRRDKLKHLKSVQLQYDVDESDEPFSNIRFVKKAKENGIPENVHKGGLSDRKETTNNFPDNKLQLKSEIEILEEELSKPAAEEAGDFSAIANRENLKNKVQIMEKAKEINLPGNIHKADVTCAPGEIEQPQSRFSGNNIELETRVEMLEEELIEAAAVEVGLYSVVAEHGSSTNKVHAPARRLSRFYLHACKARSQDYRGNAARAIISGLVLVSKACGNDVPRLTFWLSNSILLRAIVSQAVEKLQVPASTSINKNGGQRSRPQSSFHEDNETNKSKSCDEWEEAQTFVAALERVEAWIFSRIVASVWWQTLTPHMQSTAVKGSGSKKTHARRYGLGDQDQGNFAIDLWKKAFKDACERLCPIRAGGHECGCLPVLARLVMEQLVHRLDVAMFNAILRESAEEMPTDPVSDPISDPKVLPIPAGKSSFGAGAQLKNAVGNWSRWLTDIFGIDDSDSDDKVELDSNRLESGASFKVFHLLNALSDLMMLPFEMLADKSTRKEVCPTFGAHIIERVLNNFVPDEFNPDPIPDAIFESLDSEDLAKDGKESITSFPCIATPTIYSPPSTASLTNIIGEVGNQTLQRSGSALLKKSYTSDDELDELDSPLTSIIIDNSRVSPASTASNWTPKGKGGRKVVRYQLLRQIWKDGE
ncbi:uncharacterized protein LOC8278411 [Ricinus communis]|uniref:C2 NT-type domain-containing protein n=1 Tax=Ricinus communis TaxID=3988 RepID=B9RMI3_RICCO|nr:uncharacterized protein LOC8278411 [Ricinus communis]XP_015572244.1 uncharacterized protein LOC8278411 [Ricinus communis]XP_015572245.1 uncharacterized protein LOC8278411 [Ricinus communis]XP_015572246.1 uncharacterized protein LOC8278411 [Ricinus communis]EEF47506.1 conserved hypothetical protein [Ricinus communis]|eukprot:XP_002514952.1 uncharacterized protein LOC8278411 [Ricinus communis]